jgi:tRNA nucleotidyltransferase (CCA-adding enzyme)
MIEEVRANIERIMLFGSVIEKTPQEAQDVDFFIAYRGTDFRSIRHHLLSVPVGRRVVVENVEAEYANHPKWPREDPVVSRILRFFVYPPERDSTA